MLACFGPPRRLRCNARVHIPYEAHESADPSLGLRSRRQSVAHGVGRSLRRAGLRPNQARAFPACLCARICRARGRGRGHCRQCGRADLRQHRRRARSERSDAHASGRRLPAPRRRSYQRCDPCDRARARPAQGQALGQDPHGRGPVRPHRHALPAAGAACAFGRAAARARALPREIYPRRRCARRRGESAARRHQRAPRHARHHLQPERVGGRAELYVGARRRRRPRRSSGFRAGGGATDNKAIIAEMVALRAERARLLGYATFADYRLDDTMAKTPQAVRGLLERVWAPGRRRAMADRDALQALVQAEGKNFALAPWDWRYYAEKLRKARCDIDEATTKPYLQLERIIEAAFYTANRLFGLTFERRDGVPVWHDEVRVWEVRDAAGRHRGLFFGDYFARTSKHSGAWMTALRDQERLRGDLHPLVVNVMNFSKAGEGEPTLLSFDDAKTLFHEFGHALHALLSDVTYPMIAGTNVLLDWSELPSQLFEHWLERPEILRRFALHYRTGEPLPEDQLRRLLAARTFNQGQTTLEYVASALIDLDMHLKAAAGDGFDIDGFEQAELARIGMPAEIVMRHRPTHFQHVFAGAGYASAYYSYLWSEVLDADAFAAFEETGDIFDAGVAKRLHDHVYAAGGTRDP